MMIKDEVLRCLEKHDRSINWLAKELGVSWTAVKDKLKKDTFTGNELLDLCIIFDDFNYKKLIENRRLKSFDSIDDESDVRIHIAGNKIGTFCKNIKWQSFKDEESENLFNSVIPELSMTLKKSLIIEKNIIKEMESLGLKYSIELVE